LNTKPPAGHPKYQKTLIVA